MRTFTSADVKNHFAEIIDKALAALVAFTMYDRPVVVVMAAEEYERLRASEGNAGNVQARQTKAKV